MLATPQRTLPHLRLALKRLLRLRAKLLQLRLPLRLRAKLLQLRLPLRLRAKLLQLRLKTMPLLPPGRLPPRPKYSKYFC